MIIVQSPSSIFKCAFDVDKIITPSFSKPQITSNIQKRYDVINSKILNLDSKVKVDLTFK